MYLTRFGLNLPSWDELCRRDPYYAWKDIESKRTDANISKEQCYNIPAPKTNRDIENEQYYMELAKLEEYFPTDYEPVPEWKITSDRITELLEA